ncbi:phage holin family protein [Microlunatus antarcticus]|uniref:Tetrahydromethanopterin S-methyltransferase subunit G n=1 Tax=Microlunatus antarcticus TaxID=53388 RepID=A0A7W5P5L8_9ACTN|nr:tetrahydromethanopterin S-methyltransferase subunit G [Microlunatus antarcticus]
MSTGYTAPDPTPGYPGVPQGQDQEISLGERLGNVTRDLSTLMQQEVALAKAEVKQSGSQLGKGVGLLAGAGIGGFFVLLFLSVSLWWAIGNGTGRGWAALIVAVVWAIVAAVLLTVGRKELKRVRGLPTTADTLGKIPNAVKGKEEDNR